MNYIDKARKLDEVRYAIRGPLLQEANRMEAQGQKILKLNIGNPYPFGLEAPDYIIDTLVKNIRASQGYLDSKGLLASRQAVAEYCRKKNFPNVDVDDIYLGNGGSEMIIMAMQALLNPKDQVLVPSPGYPLWSAAVHLSDGVAVPYVCDEQADWNPDLDDIRKKITHRTRAIVVINPNNPTGALYDKDVLQGIVDIAREYNLVIFCDEIYDRLVMDGLTHTSIASLAPDLFVVTMNGLSKSHLVCGFRVGWMVLSGDNSKAKDYIDGLTLMASMRLCSNAPAQFIIPAALADMESPKKLMSPGGRMYEQRECVCNILAEIPGISFVRPKAAFYIFPKLDKKRFNIKSDTQFALDLLKAKNVLVVEGSGFDWPGQDHFRIVCLADVPMLSDALGRIKDFLADYRQA